MKAAQIFSYGTPDVLAVTDVERPEPGPGQVLVAVAASSVNGHDALVRAGAAKIISGRRFPVGVGLDFAGSVAATGPGVDSVRAGDPVWGTVHPREKHTIAGAAEYVVVAADRVGPIPAGMSSVQAAALVVPGITALTALRGATHLKAGESVLVRGAAGGVGMAAVQLAHAFGGRVTALARDRHAAALTDRGAERVHDYRHTAPDEIGLFDVIVDTVGTDLARYRRRLTKSGRMVTVGLSGPAIAAIAASTVFGSRRIRTFSADPRTAQLAELAEQFAAGAVVPVIDGVYPLADIASAHRAFGKGGAQGRQIVQIASS
ncbi:quinone oxidoreductase family protein [Paractinoplanes toevensis]|uniref:NADPH:quinone reductase n=1 Tax=Paractinoplanes toevensis TaxID=571911 RepID=A0A919W112_9ACTN|nr:NAD(P)-dependent alcohol dehydrogenase [Actinoplanes toevensis]GIM89869.1 NADPH:quinone reductase [Actinoplanes toevensis]